jgi:putative two-component system response regulator
MARTMGLDQQMLELIRWASPLHDVGKIGIPDGVLLKPGRLTETEMEVMKSHTTIGARILMGGQSPLVQMAESIALNHHERWDGSGYPQGLKGDAIPLAARVVAVADVFDALTHTRPYRDAWSLEATRAEIARGVGTHFDPRIAEIFLGLPISSQVQ